MKIEFSNLNTQYATEYKLKKVVKEVFISEEIETEVVYEKDDFKYLIEASSIGDDKEVGMIGIQCGNNTFMRMAVMKHNEGSFDLKKCIAKKKINFNGKLDCLINNQINIFNYEADTTQTVQGTIQRQTYTKSELIYVGEYQQEIEDIYDLNKMLSFIGTYPDYSSDGYSIETIQLTVLPEFNYETGLVNNQIQEYGVYIGHKVEIFVQYSRLFSNISLGSSWVPIQSGGFYYKFEVNTDWKAPEIYIIDQLNQFGEKPKYGSVAFLKGRYSVFSNTTISNTVLLNDILIDIFSCTGFNFISNFFGINPDGSNSNTPEYIFAEDFSHKIKIVQSYDIIRESALEDSFGISGDIDTKELLYDLCTLFNLVIVTYYDTSTIRMEHISYFSSKGINLLTKDYEIGEIELNREQVDAENFTMAAITPTEGFYKVEVKYTNIDLYKEPNEKNYSTKLIITDLTGTINNKDYEKDEYKPLFYLLSTDGSNVIGLNTPFSMKNLFSTLHQSGRSMKNGLVNGVQTTFDSFSIGMKTSIKFNSSVKSWELIDPYMSILTEYGTFRIEDVEIDDKNIITLNVSK